MYIYEVSQYTGEPVETKEMAPKWFAIADIPYADMWPGDSDWMSLYFAGHNVAGRAVFDGATYALISTDFRAI